MPHAPAGTGPPPHTRPHIPLVPLAHVRGPAVGAGVEARARQRTGLSSPERMVRNEPQFDVISARGDHPFLARPFEHDEFELGLDALFEFGL
ncbi:hypothetical protein ACIO8F_05910 [Streptomyces sp. NPDC087228]|uniref:hypothetical protein n=1 Tax=unclassified Streptomyces TaxID=2593676 RepID=UPI0033C8AAC7